MATPVEKLRQQIAELKARGGDTSVLEAALHECLALVVKGNALLTEKQAKNR
jgi:hypothetical protein